MPEPEDPMPEPYVGPVKVPVRNWAKQCLTVDQEQAHSSEWKDGFNWAMSVMAIWLDFPAATDIDKRGVGMCKSALLGRLCRGEEIRRVPCPKHKGHMWCRYGMMEDTECCNGTGWLKNPPTDAANAPQ